MLPGSGAQSADEDGTCVTRPEGLLYGGLPWLAGDEIPAIEPHVDVCGIQLPRNAFDIALICPVVRDEDADQCRRGNRTSTRRPCSFRRHVRSQRLGDQPGFPLRPSRSRGPIGETRGNTRPSRGAMRLPSAAILGEPADQGKRKTIITWREGGIVESLVTQPATMGAPARGATSMGWSTPMSALGLESSSTPEFIIYSRKAQHSRRRPARHDRRRVGPHAPLHEKDRREFRTPRAGHVHRECPITSRVS